MQFNRDKTVLFRLCSASAAVGFMAASCLLLAGCAMSSEAKNDSPAKHPPVQNAAVFLAGEWKGVLSSHAGVFHGDLTLMPASGQVFSADLRVYRFGLLASGTFHFQATFDPATQTLGLSNGSMALRSMKAVYTAERDELAGNAFDASGAQEHFVFMRAPEINPRLTNYRKLHNSEDQLLVLSDNPTDRLR